MTIYRQCTDDIDQPILVIPHQMLSNGAPDGFIWGWRLEHEIGPGQWCLLSEDEQDLSGPEGETFVRVRLSDGMLFFMDPQDYPGLDSFPGDEGAWPAWQRRDEWCHFWDGPGWSRSLPAGRFRLAGVEMSREQLLVLLPQLCPDLEAVLYPGQNAGGRSWTHFWTIGGQTGNWNKFSGETMTVEALDERPLKPGQTRPHQLVVVSYYDKLQAVNSVRAVRRSFCLAYRRPVPGPVLLQPVDVRYLADCWPVRKLRAVLHPEELVAAGLAPEADPLL